MRDRQADYEAYFGDRLDPPSAEWYASYLRAAREPSLIALAVPRRGREQAPPVEQYRFLWLPSFHPPFAIRIARGASDDPDAGALLTVKELARLTGFTLPGPLVRVTTVELPADRWAALRTQLDVGFWPLPSEPTRESRSGLDGAEWVMEGVRGTEYHVVHRWSPDEHSPAADQAFRAAALAFVDASGLASRIAPEIY